MKLIIALAMLAVPHSSAIGQSAPARPSFEVAAVKPAPPPARGFRVGMGADAGMLNYSNVSLKDLIAQAYAIKDYQISGPEWLGNQRFDLVAKLPSNSLKSQIPLMLQSLLFERFRLAIHREKRELRGYALVVSKNGPKLKASPSDPDSDAHGRVPAGNDVVIIGGAGLGQGGGGGLGGGGGSGGNGIQPPPRGPFIMTRGSGHIEAKMQDLTSIANILARQLDQPVVDETGISGFYDFTLDWTPDDSQGPARLGPRGGGQGRRGGSVAVQAGNDTALTSAASDNKPPLLLAIQEQLGLMLKAKKVSLDLLIIDHAERVPLEN